MLAILGSLFGLSGLPWFSHRLNVAENGRKRPTASSTVEQTTAASSSLDGINGLPTTPLQRGFYGLVSRVGPNAFEVDRIGMQNELSKDVLRREDSLFGMAEATPAGGLRLTAAASDTLSAALGLRANDILLAVDGDSQFASTPERALALYRHLYDAATTTTISIERNGEIFSVRISFR